MLAGGFVAVSWLWIRLRETQIALTDLERQQIVAETQLTIAARVQRSLLPALPEPSAGISWYAAVDPARVASTAGPTTERLLPSAWWPDRPEPPFTF